MRKYLIERIVNGQFVYCMRRADTLQNACKDMENVTRVVTLW